VHDILLTSQGSRLARREYGSLLSALIDQPQNPALRLQIMSAVYVAFTTNIELEVKIDDLVMD
ncbi:TPA: hypothetical protein OTZ41_004252, partial [Raoultella ornithinolytica]|nr:hypothetical protein [Raoultella ornithinolytica]